MIRSAALGGLFIGVLSALPILGAANCCCCLWVVSGGAIAAFLETQRTGRTVTPGEGAAVGAFSGVFGALIWLPIAIAVALVLGPLQAAVLGGLMRNARDMPAEAREILEGWSQPTSPARLTLQFAFQLCVGVLFASLGGLLSAAYFRKDVPPALGGTYVPPIPPQ